MYYVFWRYTGVRVDTFNKFDVDDVLVEYT